VITPIRGNKSLNFVSPLVITFYSTGSKYAMPR
jgi:hypothetical protein